MPRAAWVERGGIVGANALGEWQQGLNLAPASESPKGTTAQVSDSAVFGVGTSEFVILTMADDGVAAGPGPRFEKH